MKYRPLGTTGMNISEIGFGAWGIGGTMWLGAEDGRSMKALHRAVDLGVNFFDTALVYGNGHSETLIRQLLGERKEKIFVASKIPPKNSRWPARAGTPLRDAFPAAHIIESTERSLSNLDVESIDLQQFHVWSDEWAGADEIWTAVGRLKQEGKIRAFGISVNDHDPRSAMEAAKTGRVDTFQVIYNIFDQSPEDELFPYCRAHGIGILARVPLDEGGLTGTITPDSVFPDRDWRNKYFRGERKAEVYERAEKLKKLLGTEAATLAELALRFCLSDRAVSSVIPGMRTPENVERNASVSDGRLLSEGLIAELKNHRWMRNFYS